MISDSAKEQQIQEANEGGKGGKTGQKESDVVEYYTKYYHMSTQSPEDRSLESP